MHRKYALVISGAPNRGEKKETAPITEMVKLFRNNGYLTHYFDNNDEPDSGVFFNKMIKSLQIDYNVDCIGFCRNTKQPCRILIYVEGHGDRTGMTDMPSPAETVYALASIPNAKVEMVIDTCNSGCYINEAKKRVLKNATIYASTGEKGLSYGSLATKIVKKAEVNECVFDSIEEIVPRKTHALLQRVILTATEVFVSGVHLLRSDSDIPMFTVQKYSFS